MYAGYKNVTRIHSFHQDYAKNSMAAIPITYYRCCQYPHKWGLCIQHKGGIFAT